MIKPVLVLAAGAALLTGCISLGPKTPESLLTLTSEASTPAGTVMSGNENNALAVLEPEAPTRLNVPRVPVQVNDTEIAYLQNATWVERPARLFRNLLAETIRSQGSRMVVDSDQSVVVPTTFLRGTLREFGYDARRAAVVIRYDAIKSRTEGAVETRRFEAVVEGVAPETAFVGPALNSAANDIARQVAAWVG